MYEKELDVENKRLVRMQSEAKDEHDLRYQVCQIPFLSVFIDNIVCVFRKR